MFENMKNKPDTPKVGVGIIILDDDGKILLLKRQGSHAAGKWSLPGGHLEIGESEFDCCKRELKEETDLNLTCITSHLFTNNINVEEGLHYVTLFYFGAYKGQEKNMEPNKCSEMDWFDPSDLPYPLFGQLEMILEKEK